MKDSSKTNPKFNEDVSFLKQKIKELEKSEAKHKEAETALRTSEAKFKEIFETIEDLYYETDSEGIVKIVSPSLYRLTGWNEEDVIGRPAIKFYVDPNDRERLYLKLSEKGYVHDYEVFLKRKDGEERLASLSARLIIDDNGQQTGLRGLLRDITERKRAEEALEESELKFRALFDSANDAIFIMKNHIIIDCNRKTLDMFCCDKEGIIGCSPVDFSPEIQPDGLLSSEKATEKINMALKGIPQCFEWKHQRMDGTLFDAEVSLNNIELGDNTYLQVIARDITSRKRVEEVLCVSETRLRQVIDLVPHFIFAKDRIGRFILANKAVADAYGTTVEDLTGKTDGDFNPNKDEVNHFLRDDLLVMNSGQPKEIHEEYITDSKGNIRILQTIKIPFALSLKGDDAILGVSTDITERMLSEEALMASEAKYHSLFDNAMEGIFQTTPEGRAISVNPSLAKLLGYDSPRNFTEQITDISKHYANQEDRTTYKKILETEGIIRGFEVQLIDKEGTHIWVSINAQVIKSDEGMVLYYEGTMEDITERKHAEENLQESERKFRDLAEKSVAGVYLVQDGIFKYVNLRFAQVLGYTIDEMIGKVRAEDVIFSEDWPIVEENLRKRLSGELESLYYAFRICTKNHEIRNAEVYSSRTVYKGRPAVIGTLLDITERKQAEDEITREREKLKTLSDNAPFGMVLINNEGHFTYINRKFTELFGYTLSEIPDGRSWRRKAYPDSGYRHAIISAWIEDRKDAKPGEQHPNIFTVTCKDGTQKIIQFIFSVLVSGDYLMTCEDITEMRHLENQLRQAQKMEAIGTLAGGIAHDFNNFLTVITGYAALIQIKVDMADPLRPYVDQVLMASEKASDLTQSLLAFSRQQPVTLVPLDINNTIKAAEKLLRRLLTEDIEFSTSLTEADMIVMADKSQMDQILFNLVTNARDAMLKGGKLTIETATATIDSNFIQAHGFGEQGQYVRIIITDTGTGIDEITRSKIFDPFFTTKEVGKGTGLGLATVYGIVKKHNGYITVASTLNQCTTFNVYLPKVTMTVDEAEDTIIAITVGKETILIAEDNEGVRRFMREALQKYGYTIREAIDGEDAVRKFKEHRGIDLIIIDSVMPKKNGRETCEEIRRIDPLVKVVFTSGYTKDVVLDKGITEKEFDFIAKPLSLNKLLQKVREVLDKQQPS